MAFKMKGSPMKRNFGVSASPMKNYKKGYYSEGSSMKATDDDGTGEMKFTKTMSEGVKNKLDIKIPADPPPPVKRYMKVKRKLVHKSKYTGRTPQSQMTDAEYKRMLQKKKK